MIDSRSCRSASSCFGRGFDGGKKIRGVKVHLGVDTRRAAKLITASRWRSTSRQPTCMIRRASFRCSANSPAKASGDRRWATSATGAGVWPRPAGSSALPSSPSLAAVMAGSSQPESAGWWTSFSPGTAESLSLLIPYPRAGHAALLNVVHWLERRRDREPLAGPNDVVATAGFAAAQGDDPPRPADPTLSCRSPSDRIEGGCP